MTNHQPGNRPVIVVTGFAARMLELDDPGEIEDLPVPYTLTPRAEAELDQADADHPFGPYVRPEPTAYDFGITDDPEAEAETEAGP